MKHLWIFIFLGYHGFSQNTETHQAKAGDFEGVSGNPYFIKDWSDGMIRFSSGKVTNKFKLKFDAAQNRLLLQFNGSTFAAESKINEFIIYAKNKADSFVFRKGFPIADRGNAETFYQVLEQGQVTLLRLTSKEIVEETQILESKRSRHYRDVEQYYILRDRILYKIDKETAPLQEILSDRREELKNFISEHQLRMRSAGDLVKVVRKYNEFR